MDKMNYLDAALKILEEAGKPLTYRQITAIAFEREWIEPQGVEPSAVMNSLIMQDLKNKGVRSEFSRLGYGTYTLRRLVYKTGVEGVEARAGEREDDDLDEIIDERQPAFLNERPAELPSDRQPDYPPDRQPDRYNGRQADRYADRQPVDRQGNDRRSDRSGSRPVRDGNVDPAARPVERRGASGQGQKRPEPRSGRPRRPPSSQELWNMMDAIGNLMGFRVQPVILSDKKTNCMGWLVGGNPELAYILWVPEGTDMDAGVAELVGMNFHKVVVMATDGDLESVREFIDKCPQKGQLDLITMDRLGEMAYLGIRFMEFYNQLCDCRPLKDRRGFLSNPGGGR